MMYQDDFRKPAMKVLEEWKQRALAGTQDEWRDWLAVREYIAYLERAASVSTAQQQGVGA